MGRYYEFSQYAPVVGEGFPYHIGFTVLNDSFDEHHHDFSEIVIITGGEGLHLTDQGRFPLRSGDVFVLHPGQYHGFLESRHLGMYNISFLWGSLDSRFLGELPGYQALFRLEPIYRKQHNFTSRLHLTPEQRERVGEECRLLEREIVAKRPGYPAIFEGRFKALVGFLCRYYEENRSEKPGEEDREDLLKLGGALAILEQRFTEDLTLEELARASGYSANHFVRLCKRVYGLTPRQYVIQQRLSLAARLLGETDLPVTEIALSCGFNDPNYFSRLFKKRTGVSPGDGRKGRS